MVDCTRPLVAIVRQHLRRAGSIGGPGGSRHRRHRDRDRQESGLGSFSTQAAVVAAHAPASACRSRRLPGRHRSVVAAFGPATARQRCFHGCPFCLGRRRSRSGGSACPLPDGDLFGPALLSLPSPSRSPWRGWRRSWSRRRWSIRGISSTQSEISFTF